VRHHPAHFPAGQRERAAPGRIKKVRFRGSISVRDHGGQQHPGAGSPVREEAHHCQPVFPIR
jgi:hypothetical protein